MPTVAYSGFFNGGGGGGGGQSDSVGDYPPSYDREILEKLCIKIAFFAH